MANNQRLRWRIFITLIVLMWLATLCASPQMVGIEMKSSGDGIESYRL